MVFTIELVTNILISLGCSFILSLIILHVIRVKEMARTIREQSEQLDKVCFDYQVDLNTFKEEKDKLQGTIARLEYELEIRESQIFFMQLLEDIDKR